MRSVMLGVFFVTLLMLCGQVWRILTSAPPPPDVPRFESFTCSAPECLSGHVCPNFEWRISNATSMTVETGAIRNNDFVSMGVVPERVFSAADSYSFMANTSAFAMRVCAFGGGGEVCRVCNPFGE